VERVRLHQNAGLQSPLGEKELGLLRLATGASDDVRSASRTLKDDALARALRYALGDNIEPDSETRLFAAAARIRHPGADDPVLMERYGDLGPDGTRAATYSWRIKLWKTESGHTFHKLEVESSGVPDVKTGLLAAQRHPPNRDDEDRWWRPWSFAGIDEGVIRYSATLLPSSLEAFFAEGARHIGQNIDWWEAQWQNRAYLQLLCDPTAEIKTTGALLLALGLAGKEPGQTAIAVDALAQAAREERLDAQLLGTILRDLLSSGEVKSSRYAKSLQAALRIDPAASTCVIELLGTMLEASPEAPPKDTAMLLALLQETLVETQGMLKEPARAAIARLKLSGKGRALQKALLET
jgi:tRNA isopentenyl-2-thiomethyl-A-37 hydroxylase MiaE